MVACGGGGGADVDETMALVEGRKPGGGRLGCSEEETVGQRAEGEEGRR